MHSLRTLGFNWYNKAVKKTLKIDVSESPYGRDSLINLPSTWSFCGIIFSILARDWNSFPGPIMLVR